LIQAFQNPAFTNGERDAITIRLDDELGLSTKAADLWTLIPIDHAFSSNPAMFMAKPPGSNLSVQIGRNIQWTWENHHFMLFVEPMKRPGAAMLGLLIDDQHPVLEVYVEHNPEDSSILNTHQIYAVRPGVWIDDFLSYYGAYHRIRVVSEIRREKFRPEMEAFWKIADI
jgi:hypothetical protein